MTDEQPRTRQDQSTGTQALHLLTDIRWLFVSKEPRTIGCRFRYHPSDPFAVSIDLIPENGIHITWVVARDLLFAGTKRPSGEGDFKVWPSCRHHGPRTHLYFSLERPDGHVTFEADLRDVRRWLGSTYEMVPRGEENDLLDWDALTRSLLGRE